jgi:hypothetical protein
MADLIKPEELKKVAEARDMVLAREAHEADKRRTEEQRDLRDAFMRRQIQPDGRERLRKALVAAAERGVSQLQIFTFPSELCTDSGRAINNGDPAWPATLVGYAARAYEFYQAELQPHGYKLRAEIIDYPGGKPGDIAVTLSW